MKFRTKLKESNQLIRLTFGESDQRLPCIFSESDQGFVLKFYTEQEKPDIPDIPDIPVVPDGSTPAILGIAILGRTILGRSVVLEKLGKPTIRLEQETDKVKLGRPSIRLVEVEEIKQLDAPRIRLVDETDTPDVPVKLATPVIRLVNTEQTGNTTAILGKAILGQAILGNSGSGLEKLDAPIIRLEEVDHDSVKLDAPVIRLVDETEPDIPDPEKLATPSIRIVDETEPVEPEPVKLAAPVIRLEVEDEPDIPDEPDVPVKLGTPVIELVTEGEEPEEPDEPEQLAAPVIRLVVEEEPDVPDVPDEPEKLDAPVIELYTDPEEPDPEPEPEPDVDEVISFESVDFAKVYFGERWLYAPVVKLWCDDAPEVTLDSGTSEYVNDDVMHWTAIEGAQCYRVSVVSSKAINSWVLRDYVTADTLSYSLKPLKDKNLDAELKMYLRVTAHPRTPEDVYNNSSGTYKEYYTDEFGNTGSLTYYYPGTE